MRRVKRLDEGVRLRVEDEDDLWVLSKICRRGSYTVSHVSHTYTYTIISYRVLASRSSYWLAAAGQVQQPFNSTRVAGTDAFWWWSRSALLHRIRAR